MSVIKKPEPNTRSVFEKSADAADGAVVFQIDPPGPIDYICGGCRTVLIVGAEQGQYNNMVVRCNVCGVYNETLD